MSPGDQHRDTMAARTLEATLGWAKNTAFAGMHGGGFYYVVIRMEQGALNFGMYQLTGIGILGVFGAVLWLGTAYRTGVLMSLWNNKAALTEEAEPDTVPVFSSQEFKALDQARLTGRRILFGMIGFVGFAWSVIFGTSMFHTLLNY